MNPEVDLEQAEILDVESRPYTAKTGEARTYRGILFKYGGKIFKMGVGQNFDIAKAETKKGKKATLTLEMTTFGDSISPDFRIIDAS